MDAAAGVGGIGAGEDEPAPMDSEDGDDDDEMERDGEDDGDVTEDNITLTMEFSGLPRVQVKTRSSPDICAQADTRSGPLP